MAAGQDAAVRFSPVFPQALATQLAEKLQQLRALADAEPDEVREDAQAMLARVEDQMQQEEPRVDVLLKYLSAYTTLVTVAGPTVDTVRRLLGTVFPNVPALHP